MIDPTSAGPSATRTRPSAGASDPHTPGSARMGSWSVGTSLWRSGDRVKAVADVRAAAGHLRAAARGAARGRRACEVRRLDRLRPPAGGGVDAGPGTRRGRSGGGLRDHGAAACSRALREPARRAGAARDSSGPPDARHGGPPANLPAAEAAPRPGAGRRARSGEARAGGGELGPARLAEVQRTLAA